MSELAAIAEQIAEKEELERLRRENAELRQELRGMENYRASYFQWLAIERARMMNSSFADMAQDPFHMQLASAQSQGHATQPSAPFVGMTLHGFIGTATMC